MSKRVLITGASSGIGRALALHLASKGAQVAVCSRRPDAIEALCLEASGLKGSVIGQQCDVRDASAVQQFVGWVSEQIGGIDVLVNNAGALGPRSLVTDTSVEEFDNVMQTNVVGLFAMTRAALPHLSESEAGVLINISSGLGRFGVAKSSAYCASKFAVEGFTQALADECSGSSLTVVSLAPGMVATDMLKTYLEDDDVSAYLDPKDVASGIGRLLEDVSPAFNGRALDIDAFLSLG